MEFIIIPTHLTLDEYEKIGIETFLLGIKDLSSGFKTTVTISDIKALKSQYPNAKYFVSCNKTMLESDLSFLKETLLDLDKLNLGGICFYDLAVLEYAHELSLKTPLVWNQTHLVTNYQTCDYYYQEGVKYAYLANELTLEEWLEINEKSSIKGLGMVLGCPVVALSLRSLLTNYDQFINDNHQNRLEIEEKITGEHYLVVEENGETVFYKKNILNGSKAVLELKKKNFSYGVLDETEMDHDLFLEVASLFQRLLKEEHCEEILDKISLLIGDDTNFFEKKTIFKVKKDESK